MKKVLFILLLPVTILVNAQTIQKGIVVEQNSGNKPVAGVRIIFTGALPTLSDSSGNFSVVFLNKKEGSPLHFEEISKAGYELVNEREMKSVVLSAQKPLQIVLSHAGLLAETRLEYYKILKKTIVEDYERKLASLDQLKASYQKEKDSLTAHYEQQLQEANIHIEQVARTHNNNLNNMQAQSDSMIQKNIKKLLLMADLQRESKQFEKAEANYAEALILYQDLAEENPNEYKTMVAGCCGSLSWVQLFEKKFTQAEASARQALEIDNTLKSAQKNLAFALLYQGKYEDALKIFTGLKEDQETNKQIMDDLAELEHAGITHPDVSKIRILLAN
jgi:tetratricopeptide (TPR) repeat protein